MEEQGPSLERTRSGSRRGSGFLGLSANSLLSLRKKHTKQVCQDVQTLLAQSSASKSAAECDGRPCTVAVGFDAIAVFRGEALLEDDILLLASFSAINTYSVLAKSVLINHESVAGTAAASKKDGSVLELRPSQDCRDDGLWAGQLLANLDRAILAWQRAESKKVSSGLFLQQANVEVEVDDDMSKLLMDERCKSRYPNAIKREGGAIQGARFLAKWVLRPKKMTDLATKEVSVLLTATHHGLLVMVPALGVMFVLFWREVFSLGGVKNKLTLDYRTERRPKHPTIYCFMFDSAKGGERAQEISQLAIEAGHKSTSPLLPLPSIYPDLNASKSSTDLLYLKRTKRMSSSSAAAVDSNLISADPKHPPRFTAMFAANALQLTGIMEEDEEDEGTSTKTDEL